MNDPATDHEDPVPIHTLTATDLFAGAGGSSAGLEQAGYRVLAAANHWPTAVKTHAANHPKTQHHLANLSETDFRAFPSTDLLWASPSCVWHARAGGRRKPPVEQERLKADAGAIDRATAFAVIAAAEVHRYPAVVVENVREFTDWSLFPWWLDGMQHLGYQVQQTVIDAATIGEAQSRRRWFGVFTQGDSVDLTPPSIAPRHADRILDPDLGKPVTRRLYVTPQIEQITEKDIPHLVMYRRNARPRRADQHPLATVTAGGNHHGIATFTAAGPRFRMLTPRERARAQGFPDAYRFHGSQSDVVKQIGNAVPVRVSRFLGERVAASLGALPASSPR
ncbi:MULTISPECIES: DNA cytosine methyltransferase [Brachybacterium]|uniref:DNA (cytosine-5-)-methyltransferase n=1 Tax=Brachybacterium kimchii TaxID=2942909 RepID=A0ABY4N8Y9_9MICO|nr:MULTISPECIES: DNA cytosine methyltransferase [Brachybacterium]MCG7309724.1 DNA cytosine methyltransferase [Brachybacterium sp. ACRRE]UQN30571.1 DNA cytosine methyltransferase [Brachybacterium kimchii]